MLYFGEMLESDVVYFVTHELFETNYICVVLDDNDAYSLAAKYGTLTGAEGKEKAPMSVRDTETRSWKQIYSLIKTVWKRRVHGVMRHPIRRRTVL